MSLAIERYLSMSYLNLVKQTFTTGITILYISVIVTICIIMNIPYAFAIDLDAAFVKRYSSFGNSNIYSVFSFGRAVLVQLTSLIVITIFNCLLVQITFAQRRKRTLRQKETMLAMHQLEQSQQSNPNAKVEKKKLTSREKAEYKLTIMCITMIAVFLFGHVPLAVSYGKIWTFITGNLQTPAYKIYTRATQALALLAFSSNFIMYVSLNRKFQEALMCKDIEKERAKRNIETNTLYATMNCTNKRTGRSDCLEESCVVQTSSQPAQSSGLHPSSSVIQPNDYLQIRTENGV